MNEVLAGILNFIVLIFSRQSDRYDRWNSKHFAIQTENSINFAELWRKTSKVFLTPGVWIILITVLLARIITFFLFTAEVWSSNSVLDKR